MLIRLIAATAMAATVAIAAPAAAQSAADQARFDQAQARFDREYQVYRQEVDRLRAARTGYSSRPGYVSPGGYRTAPVVPAAGYDPRYDEPTYSDADDGDYYDPSRDYRAGTQYRERVLSTNDRVYAGTDGRYYCRRSDGTTGLIIGAAGGGILGNIIDGGRSRTVGTLLGAAVGGLAGRSVDQNQVRCR